MTQKEWLLRVTYAQYCENERCVICGERFPDYDNLTDETEPIVTNIVKNGFHLAHQKCWDARAQENRYLDGGVDYGES